MGSITNFLENELLDHAFNNAAYTAPATIYLALATADPTDAATGASMNEVPNSGSYARTAITVGAAASRRVTQDADVDFPTLSGSLGDASHWAIVDNATHGAGNVLAHGAFGTPKPLVSGNSPTVASGEIYVEFSAGGISTFLANELLDHVFNNAAYTPPTSTFVALCDTNVTDTDTGSTISEPSTGAYARIEVDPNGGSSPTWDLAASGVVDNTHDIVWAQATADWVSGADIVAIAVLDAGTAGNVLMYNNDALPDQPVLTDDTAQIAAGALDLVMT
jgi:hypothetical protein